MALHSRSLKTRAYCCCSGFCTSGLVLEHGTACMRGHTGPIWPKTDLPKVTVCIVCEADASNKCLRDRRLNSLLWPRMHAISAGTHSTAA